MLIKVGEKEFEATFNAFTPIAFSRYFHVVNPNGTRRPKDINEAVGAILAAQNEYGFPPPIAPLLEIFYACIKTATPKFDEMFDEWVLAFPADVHQSGALGRFLFRRDGNCSGQLFSIGERGHGHRDRRRGKRRRCQASLATRATRDTSTTASNAA